MRISKEPQVRCNEILDTAEHLFTTKGYSQTAMMDLANAMGIAKGTLYYHFKSKEDVMDAIIHRTLTRKVERAKHIIADKNTKVIDKLFILLMDQNSEQNTDQNEPHESELAEQFHQPENAEMHQKSMQQVILHMAPVLAEIIQQGVDEGIFSTDYPLESVEILLASSSLLFDKGIFHRSEEENRQKARAFIDTMERIIGAKKGCFDGILPLLQK